MLCNLVLKRQTLCTQAKAIKSKFLKISKIDFLFFLLILLIKDGFATDLLINRLLMLILSFYLMFYDFLLYIFLYFCVVNTAIFFHFKFFIFQCSVRGQAKGRLCRGGGGSLAISDQRSGSRSRRGWVSKNQIAVSTPARLTAVAISIATRPFKFREMSVSIHSFGFSVVDPDPGSSAILTLGSGIGFFRVPDPKPIFLTKCFG